MLVNVKGLFSRYTIDQSIVQECQEAQNGKVLCLFGNPAYLSFLYNMPVFSSHTSTMGAVGQACGKLFVPNMVGQ